MAWSVLVPTYAPADGWTCRCVLRSAGPSAGLSLVGVANGAGWDFSLPSSQSALLPAGEVGWQAIVKKGDESRTVLDGRSTICPSLETATVYDPLTPAERWLAALQSVQPALLANGYASMTCDGTTATFRSPAEYFAALASAQENVLRERGSRGGATPCGTKDGRRGRSSVIKSYFTPTR